MGSTRCGPYRCRWRRSLIVSFAAGSGAQTWPTARPVSAQLLTPAPRRSARRRRLPAPRTRRQLADGRQVPDGDEQAVCPERSDLARAVAEQVGAGDVQAGERVDHRSSGSAIAQRRKHRSPSRRPVRGGHAGQADGRGDRRVCPLERRRDQPGLVVDRLEPEVERVEHLDLQAAPPGRAGPAAVDPGLAGRRRRAARLARPRRGVPGRRRSRGSGRTIRPGSAARSDARRPGVTAPGAISGSSVAALVAGASGSAGVSRARPAGTNSRSATQSPSLARPSNGRATNCVAAARAVRPWQAL